MFRFFINLFKTDNDIERRTVECHEHGLQEACFVCQHLVKSLYDKKNRGFVQTVGSEKKRPDAWCDLCEKKRIESSEDGEWCHESEEFAQVKLTCGGCYDQMKHYSAVG